MADDEFPSPVSYETPQAASKAPSKAPSETPSEKTSEATAELSPDASEGSQKPSKFLLWALVALVALALGAGSRLFWDGLKEEAAGEDQPTLTLPEKGVRSDAWSLKLFQEALALRSAGNVCVAPASTADLLAQLRHVSKGESRKWLDAQKLPGVARPLESLAASPVDFMRLFADIDLKFQPEVTAEEALRVPMRRDFTKALSLANGMATVQSGGAFERLLGSEAMSSESRLIGVSASLFAEEWLHPFVEESGRGGREFYNVDGGMPSVRMATCSAPVLSAEAPDGSWRAVALFFKREGRKGQPCCLVAVLPKGDDARGFASELGAEKLSEIREALARATAQPLRVTLPLRQLCASAGTLGGDLQPLLLRCGLGNLFTKSADFSGLAAEPLRLDRALCRYELYLPTRSEQEAPLSPAPELSFNKPFIWFIGDLCSQNPPLFMGLMEML